MDTPLKQASLLFLIKDNSILLAMKKRGFGAGRWNGVGGKPELSETIEQTAVRECQEEIEVTPVDYKKVAELTFMFVDNPDWDQKVIVFMCTTWEGEPKETEEMKPMWYEQDSLPYDEMWQDDRFWLPKVLEGKYVTASFSFDKDDNLLTNEVHDEAIKD